MKKIAIILLTAVISIILSSCGLGLEDLWPEYEDTYFRYASRSGSDTGVFIGFTELGLEQTHMVLPSHINELRMMGIGHERSTLMYSEIVSNFNHKNLEKLYIDIEDFEGTHFGNTKFISLEIPNSYIVWWNTLIPIEMAFSFPGFIYGYNLYDYGNYRLTAGRFTHKLANVSYIYNYEDSPNDGYYWVDSYDNTVVDFIPPEPIREGYTFGGWYKEEESINEWNFEENKVGPELVITDRDQFDESDITFLYAKWI